MQTRAIWDGEEVVHGRMNRCLKETHACYRLCLWVSLQYGSLYREDTEQVLVGSR